MKLTDIEKLCDEFAQLSNGIYDFEKHSMYVATFHSTSIEGSTLTESQVIDLLEYGKTAAMKPFEDHLMVKDHFNAIMYAMELAQQKEEISISRIRKICGMVLRNTGKTVHTISGTYTTSDGDFRLGGVFAGSRQFPDFRKIPVLIDRLVEEANSGLKSAAGFEEKCKLAFRVHFDFVTIHPFGDGNGRTSRILMNYIQLYFGLPMGIVFRNDRLRYIDALEQARKKESLEPFYDFMFNQYAKYLKKEIKAIKSAQAE